MKSPEIGTEVRLRATFKDIDGVLSDPATISLTVEDPAGAKTTYTYAGAQVQKKSTGVYYYDLTFDQAGRWNYRWLSTGTPAVSESSLINVEAPTTS